MNCGYVYFAVIFASKSSGLEVVRLPLERASFLEKTRSENQCSGGVDHYSIDGGRVAWTEAERNASRSLAYLVRKILLRL